MYDGSGAECLFYIRNGVGCKVYRSKRARDYAFRTQKQYHADGLAPAVGHKFSWWGRPGYTTELARLPKRTTTTFYNKKDALAKKAQSLGYDYYDDHSGNVGYIGNKLVYIDFGPLCRPRRMKKCEA